MAVPRLTYSSRCENQSTVGLCNVSSRWLLCRDVM